MELMLYELDKDMNLLKNNTIPSPWNSLYKISNHTADLKEELGNLLRLIHIVTTLPDKYTLHINEMANDIIKKFNKINDKWKKTIVDINQLIDDHKSLFKKLIEMRKRLESKIQELEDFIRPDKHLNINKFIKEGQLILDKIKKKNLTHHIQKANEISSQVYFITI